jgi:hypothetical protein
VQTAKDIAYKDGVLTLQDVSAMTVFFSDRPQRCHVPQRSFPKKNGPRIAIVSRAIRAATCYRSSMTKRLQQAPSSCSTIPALTATI